VQAGIQAPLELGQEHRCARHGPESTGRDGHAAQ
jgi:hypothetical protein